VVVGWDSGDAAARSIRNGLQFLKAASSVHITMIDPIASVSENGEEPGADVARFLSRHAIRVEVDVLPSGGKKVGEVLRQHATDVGAGLVVMGAYQHSRIQERLFGGVTKSMLHQSDIALFLSH
jgi:nucleotide-binding universal stress UspA family protein